MTPHATVSQRAAAAPSTKALQGTVVTHIPQRNNGIGVVVLHSYGHGVTEPISQGWNATSDRFGFVAIYPSRGADWNAGLCCGTAAKDGRDDVRWLTDEITSVKRRLALRTIYLAGNSNGGMMVERLVTESPALTDRFVTWAAAPEMPNMGTWNGYGYLFHGSNDVTVPSAGGVVPIAGHPTTVEPSSRLRRCLPRAHLLDIAFPDAGHAPPPNWPALAWGVLATRAFSASAGPRCPD